MAASISTLMDTGSHPSLLAKQTLALIAATGSIAHATIVATDGNGKKELVDKYSPPGEETINHLSDAIRISFGIERGREYDISGSAPTKCLSSNYRPFGRTLSLERALNCACAPA